MERPKIKRRERDTIIQALRAGVVPRLGLQHIQVGRAGEIAEMVRDVERIAEGGAAIRFVIGEYGSGKTFFLNLVRLVALEKGLVVLSANLAPDRRIHATGGQARSLFAELTRNASTRTKPDGGALASVVERFVTQAIREAETAERTPDAVIRDKLGHLEELTGGYDFATVIAKYWEGHETGDEELKSNASRWLRALINDQFRRLEDLCETLEMPVHPWHGDIAQDVKARARKNPRGILLITPESLEAMFVLRGAEIPRLFTGTQAIVIDELHALLDSERGGTCQRL